MKQKKFYRFLLKDDKRIGVLYAPEGTDTRFGVDSLAVESYENTLFTLKGGVYTPFMNSNVLANFANKDLKLLIEDNLPECYPLEFLPIKTISEEHGDNLYYIIHFTKIFDVIDEENSIRVSATSSIVKPYLDYAKVKDLDFFNSTARINGIIVSGKIKRLMKKNRLDAGIEFKEVPYVL